MAHVEQSIGIMPDHKGNPMGIHLNPREFSQSALREILGYQLSTLDITTILINTGDATISIFPNEVDKLRENPTEKQQEFLDTTSEIMGYSKQVVVYRIQKKKDK